MHSLYTCYHSKVGELLGTMYVAFLIFLVSCFFQGKGGHFLGQPFSKRGELVNYRATQLGVIVAPGRMCVLT